jgi:hypothetical protein
VTSERPTTPTRLQPTYAAARAEFLDACATAGARVQHFVHPLQGREGEELAIDVAELGPADAADVVMIVSGTHGVEGYCGSALQSHWLRDRAGQRPDGVRVVLVHALNPFGFSWVRRTDEHNVDLNRNFIDWDDTPPVRPSYDEIARLLVPEDWNDETVAAADAALFERLATVPFAEFQETISGGQFSHPDGVFYGGDGPSWSHRWLVQWWNDGLGDPDRLALIDLHTGLGEWGHGELISSESIGSPDHDRAIRWWGEVTSMVDGDSVSAELVGDWLAAAPAHLPDVELTAVALEYGTVDSISVVNALRADAWLHAHGDPTGDSAADVRAAVRAAFADDAPEWIETVERRFDEVVDQTFRALAG